MSVIISGNTGVDTVGPNTIGASQVIDGSIPIGKLDFVPPFTKEYVSAEQTITNGAAFTLTHGLGVKYKNASVWLVCKITDLGYPVGTELELGTRQEHSTGAYGFTTRTASTTGITVTINSLGLYIHAGNGVGAPTAITAANWRLVVRAWA